MMNASMQPMSGIPMPPTDGPSAINAISLADITTALRRWWRPCLVVGVLVGAAASIAIVAMFRPPYKSTATLMINAHPGFIAFDTKSTQQNFFDTQIELIKSPVILEKVARRQDIVSLPEAQEAIDLLDWLRKGLAVTIRGKSSLCEISFTTHSPRSAQIVADAITTVYLDHHERKRETDTETIIRELERQIKDRESGIARSRANLVALVEQTYGPEAALSNGKTIVVGSNPLSNAKQRLAVLEVDRILLNGEIVALQQRNGDQTFIIPESEVIEGVRQDPAVVEQDAKINSALATVRKWRELAIGAPSSVYAEKAAVLEASIEKLESELDERKRIARERILAKMKEKALAKSSDLLRDAQDRLAKLNTEIGHYKSLEESERARVATQGGDLTKIDFEQDDLAHDNAVLELLQNRLSQMRTENFAPAQVHLELKAGLPLLPVTNGPYSQIALAVLAAFAAPFGLAVLWERVSRRIATGAQVVPSTNLNLLGEISRLPSRVASSNSQFDGAFNRDRMMYEESVDALRVSLMHMPAYASLRSIVLTSAISGEGKSNLATSLAVSIAQGTNDATILVDADLRAPHLHHLLKIDQSPGLSDVLAGTCSLDDACVLINRLGISVLPAGSVEVHPHLLLRNGSFQRLLSQLRQRYRHVIVDTPPILAVSESVILAAAGDGVLLCTMRDVSRAPQLKLAHERLKRIGANVLGAVINGVPSRTWANQYGAYGYGYSSRRLINSTVDKFSRSESDGGGQDG